MSLIDEWAANWNIPRAAINELFDSLPDQPEPTGKRPGSEDEAQQAIRLEACRRGMRLWRNNVGACQDQTGRFIRYGLANDSQKINSKIKSADLIGITPHVVTQEDVGRTLGIFTSVEVKAPGWRFKGTPREKAQFAWMELVARMGGRAMFSTGPELL